MAAPTFLTASWRYLAMLNYEVDPALLLPLVPQGTELDTWNGRTYASIVGFMFLETALLGVPIPFHRNFEELNLRFYVRRKGPEGWRRGVVFVKEIVPRRAIAFVARSVYNENYVALPMRHRLELAGDTLSNGGAVEYGWKLNDSWHHVRVVTTGAPQPLAEGSEEEFITEHFWGYAAQRNGGCVEYQVEHPRWRVWQAASCGLECDRTALYGAEMGSMLEGQPVSAFVAEGSPVVVRRGIRIC